MVEPTNADITSGPLANFPPTSSPELDTLLATFRSKVFLPAHLPAKQQALVYKQKHQKMLNSEPFHVEIGREKVQLTPLDRTRDEPGTRRGLAQVLGLMKEQRDWENLPRFLEELLLAGRNLSEAQFEKIVRRANEAGMQHIVIECVKRAKNTGLVLKDLRVVRQVMWGAHVRGLQRGWDKKGLEKALVYAEYVAHSLESELHSGGRAIDTQDARAQPDIIGVLLEICAFRATRFLDGKDEDGRVGRYAERLMYTWPNTTLPDFTTDINNNNNNNHDEQSSEVTQEAEAGNPNMDTEQQTTNSKPKPERIAARQANYELQRWVPVWKGMQVSVQVLDPKTQTARWLKDTLPSIEKMLLQAQEVVERGLAENATTPRGLKWYLDLQKI